MREIRLIEDPVVAPIKKENEYLLLDGHLRIYCPRISQTLGS